MSDYLRWFVGFLVGLVALINAAEPAAGQSAETNPLELESKILLGNISGRIDHMAVDLKKQRLFIAELGNDSVGVVDIASRTLMHPDRCACGSGACRYRNAGDIVYTARASARSGRHW